ncbi:hypothetical protein F5Y14DRAFT_435914 [Nemania sp. NC0429]|nr:hypothetical protein F5Y14DRAFT_435914 [Nemania sp. NC0429]
MARKRGGRGRGGAKSSSIHQSSAATPVPPAMPTVPVARTAGAVQDSTPAAGQSDISASASGATNFAPNHTNGPRSTSFKRGGGQVRNHNLRTPQQQIVDSNKENAAPIQSNDTASRAALSNSTSLTPLAAMENRGEPQKPGTRSHSALDVASTASSVNPVADGSSPPCLEGEPLHVVADRLTLGDTPSNEQPDHQSLIKATAAAEAAALPVPLVVAVPVLSQLPASQSEPQLSLTHGLPGLIEPTTDEGRAEREYHLKFMREALDMGDLALKTNETPVGCVLVYKGRVIARGMNATNITRNGTRHAEFMALSALLSRREASDVVMTNKNQEFGDASWGDVDPKDGHIYPYGQKLHPAPVVNRSIISECVLYVTVEPCVMCASLLRQLGIKKVYFGAVNDKFGGTGGVFRVHMNSKPVPVPKGRPYQRGYGPHDVNIISKGRVIALARDEDEGDGGNVEAGYPVEGGYLRDDAVSLLRRFYVQENGRAPQPRKKEGRAARLYAAMEGQNKTASVSDLSDNTPETPVEAEAPMLLQGKPEPVLSVECI